MNTLEAFGFLLNLIVIIYILNKLINSKIKVSKGIFIFLSFCLFVLCLFSYFYSGSYLRVFVNVLLFMVYLYFLYKTDLKKSIIVALISEMIMIISEIIYMLFILIIFNFDTDYILSNIKGSPIANCIIDIIAVLLIFNKKFVSFVIKLEDGLINFKINNKKIFFYLLLLTLTLNVLIVMPYSAEKTINILMISLTFMIIYCLILYYALNEKNENIKFKIENEALMTSLNDYEKMLDYQRVNNHENKNQLLIIKTMIERKDKRVSDFIKEIINDKRIDNEELYSKVKKLPTGGLQGIIYQKMLIMNDDKIEFFLVIDKKIKAIDFSKINSKTNYDICRIVGILLDNAIDESKKVEKKEININIYFDEYFIIEISNYFVGNLDVEKIYNKGYSTKGKGHGYGLTLVKNIIEQNKNVINENKIEKNIFTQIIKIKM